LDSRAAALISDIKKSGGRRVLVCDFSGPTGLTALGIDLANEFSATIAREGGGVIEPVDRSKIPELLHQVRLERENADSHLQGELAAGQLSADDFVSGELSVEGDDVTVRLDLYNVDSDQRIDSQEASIIMYSEAEKLFNTQIHDSPQSAYPFAGTEGYSTPQCIHCPNAQFSDAAAREKVQGTVVVMTVIGPDGKVESLHLLKGLPYGLSESAIAAVQTWQLKPALDPGGKPAAVRDAIDIVFHLY
jgi:TonB family protein